MRTRASSTISLLRSRASLILSSVLTWLTNLLISCLSASTTIAVFVPLIFMSGIAGAIFTDQAFSITAGLGVSYIVGIMLLPVVYMLAYRVRKRRKKAGHKVHEGEKLAERINSWLDRTYTRIIDSVFAHKVLWLIVTALIIPLCVVMFYVLPVERMPQIDQNEMIVRIEWNENINVDENASRVNFILCNLDNTVVQNSAYIGVQDYLLDAGSELSPSEAEIYIKATDPEKIEQLQNKITQHIAEKYPKAIATFAPPENIFEKIFASDEAPLEARIFSSEKGRTGNTGAILSLESEIENATGLASQGIPLRDRINIVIDREKLLVYRVDYSTVSRALRTAFKSNKVSTLRSYQQYLPIGISGNIRPIEDILTNTLVATMPDQKGSVSEIPLSYLVRLVRDQDLKNISAGKNGEYVPLDYYAIDAPNAIIDKIKATVNATPGWEVEFTGSIFSNAKLMHEMVIILLISIMLMFFILCAQFESFVQPLIVLIEIPLDTAFALITLWIFGHTLNLMSAIGIIVTCGIVVNDSILKLDAINELRKQGMPLIEAIHTAGMRRLRPIIMTSLTTIFAMVPLLFTSDMGSELQRPLAIAMIGSMVVGTLISIFLIPLVYWLIYRKTQKNALR